MRGEHASRASGERGGAGARARARAACAVQAWCIILSNVVFSAPLLDHYANAMQPPGPGERWLQRVRSSALVEDFCRRTLPNATSTDLQQCRSNFLEPVLGNTGSVSAPSVGGGAEELYPCRGADTITLAPPPDAGVGAGAGYRLALLLAGADPAAAASESEEQFSEVVLEDSQSPLTFERIAPHSWYSVWSAPLDGGGRRVAAWSVTRSRPRPRPLPVVQFNPPEHFEFQDGGLTTEMSWNRTEDGGCDYTAFYTCGLLQPYDLPVDVGPGELLSLPAQRLPFGAACNATVVSRLAEREARAVFPFTTPACPRVRTPQLCLPERPSGVRTEAAASGARSAGGEPLYAVLVRWESPEYPPHLYRVTVKSIQGSYFDNTTVGGNATEARLEDAPLNGYYHVLVTAAAPAGEASSDVVTGLARPPQESAWARAAGWAAAACCAAALLAAAALWACRRARLHHQMRRHLYFEELEQNAPKDLPLLESELAHAPAAEGEGEGDAFELRSERVLLCDVLGEGAFGVVRKGWIADRGKEVAVKMLKDLPTAEDMRQFRQEMEVMKSVGAHAHVVSLLGCVTTGRRMMIVVEYCARGDLLNYLRCAWDDMASRRKNKQLERHSYLIDKLRPNLNADIEARPNFIVNKLYDLQGVCEAELSAVDLLSFCRQIAMGMEFLASNRVVHRDLAARNVLVCANKTVKIADFGLSRDVYQDNQYTKTGNGKLPVKWMALESLTHQLYTTQSDVWSFGVVVWETVTLGGAPYPGVSAAQLPRMLRGGYRMPRPHNCAHEIYELMSSCWRTRPKERPTFAELHGRLDALLNGAVHKEYLNLDLLDGKDIEDSHKVPPDKVAKYWRLITRERKSNSQAANGLTLYQKLMQPLHRWRSLHALLNHYSLTPKHPSPPSAAQSFEPEERTRSAAGAPL